MPTPAIVMISAEHHEILLEQFSRAEHEDNYKRDEGFFEKLRAAFR